MREVIQRLFSNAALSHGQAIEEHGRAINALLARWRTAATLTLSANANDVRLVGAQGVRPISAAAPVSISGIHGGDDGDLITFKNIGAATITFLHENTGSLAENRMITSDGLGRAVATGQSFQIFYDAGAQRWREL